jgi:hypothetical protein
MGSQSCSQPCPFKQNKRKRFGWEYAFQNRKRKQQKTLSVLTEKNKTLTGGVHPSGLNLKALARVDREEEEISDGDRRSFREGEGYGKEQGTSPHRGKAEFLTGDYLNGDEDDGGGG